jgi:hypothetical protein
MISELEEKNFFSQVLKILGLRKAGEISISEAGTKIRKAAWKIAEDLRLNDLALTAGTDQFLTENLLLMLKAKVQPRA